jgi:hypothetical protein
VTALAAVEIPWPTTCRATVCQTALATVGPSNKPLEAALAEREGSHHATSRNTRELPADPGLMPSPQFGDHLLKLDFPTRETTNSCSKSNMRRLNSSSRSNSWRCHMDRQCAPCVHAMNATMSRTRTDNR